MAGKFSISTQWYLKKIDDTTTLDEIFEKPKVKTKKRKSELEKLKIENWQPPKERRRIKTPNTSTFSSMNNNSDLMSKLSKSPSPPILLHTTNIGYTLPVDNNEQQELENRGRGNGLAEWDRIFLLRILIVIPRMNMIYFWYKCLPVYRGQVSSTQNWGVYG